MMLRLLILPLLTLALTHAPALAANKSVPAVAACLDKAQTIETMRQCKRSVSTACIAEPENKDSTFGLVSCNDREGKEWRAVLDARTAELRKRDAYRAEAFDAANTAWRAWVEAECDFHRAEAEGGSAEGVITTECVADLTADRAISLTWQMRGNLPY
jgi:uncharacterized protein YecT (DUF1311 family)